MERLVTLQINLAPGDLRLARHTLPHQLRQLQGQADEVLLTIDLHRSAGRFGAEWEEGRAGILALAQGVPGARVETVHYGASSHERISRLFFGGRSVPAKDFRGGPYYAYFYGLTAAQHDLVFHLDADMLLGGGSSTWIAEARDRLGREKDVLVTAPLPGPPAPDGCIHSLGSPSRPDEPHVHDLPAMSTRIFLLDRQRFRERVGALAPSFARGRGALMALVEGNPPRDLPEHLFTAAMRRAGLTRSDFLGRLPGLWSLHPPYRSPRFFAALPDLIRRVEQGDLPEAQRGRHDVDDSVVDWSDARSALRRNRWWRRLGRRTWAGLPGRP